MAGFPDSNENHALGGEKRAQPTARVDGVAGDKQYAIGPTRGEMVGIVHAVGIEETIAF